MEHIVLLPRLAVPKKFEFWLIITPKAWISLLLGLIELITLSLLDKSFLSIFWTVSSFQLMILTSQANQENQRCGYFYRKRHLWAILYFLYLLSSPESTPLTKSLNFGQMTVFIDLDSSFQIFMQKFKIRNESYIFNENEADFYFILFNLVLNSSNT
jgi:hypothetical protein